MKITKSLQTKIKLETEGNQANHQEIAEQRAEKTVTTTQTNHKIAEMVAATKAEADEEGMRMTKMKTKTTIDTTRAWESPKETWARV